MVQSWRQKLWHWLRSETLRDYCKKNTATLWWQQGKLRKTHNFNTPGRQLYEGETLEDGEGNHTGARCERAERRPNLWSLLGSHIYANDFSAKYNKYCGEIQFTDSLTVLEDTSRRMGKARNLGNNQAPQSRWPQRAICSIASERQWPQYGF